MCKNEDIILRPKLVLNVKDRSLFFPVVCFRRGEREGAIIVWLFWWLQISQGVCLIFFLLGMNGSLCAWAQELQQDGVCSKAALVLQLLLTTACPNYSLFRNCSSRLLSHSICFLLFLRGG